MVDCLLEQVQNFFSLVMTIVMMMYQRGWFLLVLWKTQNGDISSYKAVLQKDDYYQAQNSCTVNITTIWIKWWMKKI